MNGLDKITARIESDVKAEIDNINADTAMQCEKIKSDYAQKAQAEYWKRIKAGTESCETRVQRLGNTADMEARKAILAFKQEMVSKTFDEAVRKIVELPHNEYVAFLAAQAARAADNGTEELIFNERDAKTVGADVAKAANELVKAKGLHGGLTVSGETRDIPGGLVVKQGDIEVNCAVDTLVQMYRNELASQVAGILFD